MSRILNNSDMKELTTVTNFKFSGIRVDKLGATEYTLVTIAIDMSGSVSGFKDQLVECIQNIVTACKNTARSSYLLIRVTTFNHEVYEEHGFMNLGSIDPDAYTMIINPRGLTSLYDASINAIEATAAYSQQLDEKDIDVNGIIFVITDGYNTSGNASSGSAVADARKDINRSEALESLQMFLIGVNNTDAAFADDLKSFKDEAKFDDFIDATDTDPDTLAKLAQFVFNLTSSQSEALGTGGPSQVISSF